MNDWMADAGCRGADPELFFHAASIPVAVRVCNGCPVSAECLRFAMSTGFPLDGVWAGAVWRRGKRVTAGEAAAMDRAVDAVNRRNDELRARGGGDALQMQRDAVRRAALEMRGEGASSAQIAAALGCNRRTVTRWLTEARV